MLDSINPHDKPQDLEKSHLISFIDTSISSNKKCCSCVDSESRLPADDAFREQQCRICLITTIDGESSSRKPIISPCRCTGTMKFVHTSCLTVSPYLSIDNSEFVSSRNFFSIGSRFRPEKCIRRPDANFAGIDIDENPLLMQVFFLKRREWLHVQFLARTDPLSLHRVLWSSAEHFVFVPRRDYVHLWLGGDSLFASFGKKTLDSVNFQVKLF